MVETVLRLDCRCFSRIDESSVSLATEVSVGLSVKISLGQIACPDLRSKRILPPIQIERELFAPVEAKILSASFHARAFYRCRGVSEWFIEEFFALGCRRSMNDREFLRLFHEAKLPGEEFRHRGHLRLAWLVLSQHKKGLAEQIVASEIQRFAVANGAPNRYHDTLTRFWVRLVDHAMENAPGARSIDELLAKFPFLLDKSLPYRHWRGETFNSDRARVGWVEPDLVPLP